MQKALFLTLMFLPKTRREKKTPFAFHISEKYFP